MTVEIVGVDRLRRKLRSAQYEPVLAEARDDIGAEGVQVAQAFAPVDRGILRASIGYTPATGFGELRAAAPYARPVEARRHFWARARREMERKLPRVLAKAGDKIRRIWES